MTDTRTENARAVLMAAVDLSCHAQYCARTSGASTTSRRGRRSAVRRELRRRHCNYEEVQPS